MVFLEQIKDPYDRQARLIPGLLVVLPVLVPLVSVYGAEHAILTALLGLLGGCGAIFALANIARGNGKALEEKLVKKWGGLPTTILLRHRDKFFDRHTKNNYHSWIESKLGLPVPTKSEELSDPDEADQVYMAAARRLRELTRGDRRLLLKENIAYGFHRNMTAMKPVGIISCLIGGLYGLEIAGAFMQQEPYLDPSKLLQSGLPVAVTFMVSGVMFVAWLFYFRPSTIWRVGCVYAERLFEHLSTLNTPPRM
jgi:hypothetical protein